MSRKFDLDDIVSNHEAEKLVIGNLLKSGDPEAFSLASELLSESSFTIRKFKLVFDAMRVVFEAGQQINFGTVGLVLQQRDQMQSIGSLVDLTDGIPGLTNLGTFCEAVAEAERKRKFWLLADGIKTSIQTGESSDQIAETTQLEMMMAQSGKFRDKATRPSEIVTRAGGLERFITPGIDGVVPTPWPRLNLRTGGGLRPSQVWTVGGLSGSGKSSWALNVVAHAIEFHHKRVKLIAAEMGSDEVLFNLVCTRSRVDSQRARAGDLELDERLRIADSLQFFTEVVDDLLEIEDEACSTVPAIAGAIRKNVSEGRPIDLLVIDFIQLLSGVGKFGNRTQEMDQITYGIKRQLAKAFRIPVLNLAQLNVRKLENEQGNKNFKGKDQSEKRKDPPPPSLGDYREAGTVEQSSDVCIILRRLDTDQQFREYQLMDAFVLKQRGGKLGKLPFKFHSTLRQFEEIHHNPSTTGKEMYAHDINH